MAHHVRRNGLLHAAVLILALMATPAARAAGDVDFELNGKLADGFDKAIFKLYLPNNAKQVRAVIVFRTPVFGDVEAEWRDLASRTKCGLLWYSSFTGKATADRIAKLPPAERPVESGGALLAALIELATRTRHPELAEAPVALWSFEYEVNFAMRFLQTHPERVLALAAIHPRCGSSISENVAPAAMKVPALFIHRDGDSADWIGSVKFLCEGGRAAGAPWCSLTTHGDGGSHLGRSSELAIAYLESCLKLRTVETPFRRPAGAVRDELKAVDIEKGWFIDTVAREAFAAAARKTGRESLGWLPDERCVNKWKELSRDRRGKN